MSSRQARSGRTRVEGGADATANAARDEQTAALLRSSVGRLHRRLTRMPEDELSWSKGVLLAWIDREGPMTTAALARAEGVTAQSAGTSVAVLTDRGLLHSDPHPTDRRQVVHSLTDEGRALLAEARRSRLDWLAAAIAALTPEERDDLARGVALIDRLSRP